jgi:NADH:ubiquinone oxidoreductase subunit 6 (subunit J)
MYERVAIGLGGEGFGWRADRFAAALASDEGARRDPETRRPAMPAENAAYLGRSLFTDYLLPVELGGTLLLVAAIGAVAIAHRRAAAGRTP